MSEQFQPPFKGPYDSPPPFTPQKEGSAWKGFGLSLLLHLLLFPIGGVLSLFDSEALLFLGLFIGVSQLIYMVPAIIIAAVKGKPHIVKGLIIGAAIVFLLNAACTGIFFTAMLSSYSH